MAAVALPSCSSTASPTEGVTSPSPSPDARVAGWTSDLELLLPGLERIHPDPYHSTAKADLEAAIAALEDTVPDSNDNEVMVGLLEIVAKVSAAGRDGHTGAFIWGEDSHYPVHSLPLRLWLFPDGVYIVAALPPYEDLVGSRVETMAGRPVAEVMAAIEPLVPRDNDETVTLLMPRFLLIPEVLHGLGIIGQVGPLDLKLTTPDGGAQSANVEPISMADYNAWAGPYGLHLPDDPQALYLSRTDEVLWWTVLPGTEDLYVQYNRVQDVGGAALEELLQAVEGEAVLRVIVDIRHNFGGETFGYPPLIAIFTNVPSSRKPIFVIAGRNTFSAASLFAAEMDLKTNAAFVGEPMGGSPNLYGNPESLALPYSGLSVTIAGEYFVRSTADDERLTIEPDIWVVLAAEDYFAHRDPSLAAIEEVP